jgi:uncharacterized damage-inducible protein DinB
MTKAALQGKFGYFKMVLGMSRKLVEQFPDNKLSVRPISEIRSAAEIVGHMYQSMVDIMSGVATGQVVDHTPPVFSTKQELLNWMDGQVAEFYATFDKITDEQLASKVKAWGEEFVGWEMLGFVYDEHWHHRGQLTVYLRLCGVAPIMIYNYEALNA